jgi:hypothetical protein
MATPAPLTTTEFAAYLAEAAQGVAPANQPTESVFARLTPHRKALLALRAKGFSSAQLVAFLKHPKIGINVSEGALRKVIAGRRHRAAEKLTIVPLKYTAKSPAPQPGASPTK